LAKLFKIVLISANSALISSSSLTSSISSSTSFTSSLINHFCFASSYSLPSRLNASAFAGTATKLHSNNSDLVILVKSFGSLSFAINHIELAFNKPASYNFSANCPFSVSTNTKSAINSFHSLFNLTVLPTISFTLYEWSIKTTGFFL
jgi:hypothetical protein